MKTSIMERIAPKLVHAPTIVLQRQAEQYDELVRSGQINTYDFSLRVQLQEGARQCRAILASRRATAVLESAKR